ncbi:hypothetical protein [Burkholderia stagnalis]|uniref:hypothetical protein n=1 Tax=Burkholderia stagnalis TaxID=1503054 RepID=UPI000F595B0F|nr:hypothetical protein [Burkholderia stagnalis]
MQKVEFSTKNYIDHVLGVIGAHEVTSSIDRSPFKADGHAVWHSFRRNVTGHRWSDEGVRTCRGYPGAKTIVNCIRVALAAAVKGLGKLADKMVDSAIGSQGGAR